LVVRKVGVWAASKVAVKVVMWAVLMVVRLVDW
jgi:hypothetical protein